MLHVQPSNRVVFVSPSCLCAEGGLDYHWDSCLKGSNQNNKVRTSSAAHSPAAASSSNHRSDWTTLVFCLFASFVPLIPPTLVPRRSSTICSTAVRPTGRRDPRSWRGVPVRPSRRPYCCPTCWTPRPTTLTCCCSRICPAGTS